MSASRESHPPLGACAGCMRRSWLLAELSGVLDYSAGDRERLLEVLALDDDRLLQALGGSRRGELRAGYERFDASEQPGATGMARICRHCAGYPATLEGPAAPQLLEVTGGVQRLVGLARAPMVAILGEKAPSDYGLEVARALARGLAVAGVSVVASLRDGIPAAAHSGALEAARPGVAVLGGGLDVACPARLRGLYGRLGEHGCVVSELPLGHSGRRWGAVASERIVVELASVVVLVEAHDSPGGLFGARVARARERVVAAVPGRIGSPLSSGPHALLMQGASLVRGAGDVIELLSALGERGVGRRSTSGAGTGASLDAGQDGDGAIARGPGLRPGLQATLERVQAGADTPEKLARQGQDPWTLLGDLGELELLGLLVRGDGGRYVPRGP